MADPNAAARFTLLRQVLDITRAQHDALQDADVERLEQLLEERQALIEQVRELTPADVPTAHQRDRLPGHRAIPRG